MLHDHWEITLLIDDIRIVIGYLSEMTGGNRVVVMIEIEKRLNLCFQTAIFAKCLKSWGNKFENCTGRATRGIIKTSCLQQMYSPECVPARSSLCYQELHHFQ